MIGTMNSVFDGLRRIKDLLDKPEYDWYFYPKSAPSTEQYPSLIMNLSGATPSLTGDGTIYAGFKGVITLLLTVSNGEGLNDFLLYDYAKEIEKILIDSGICRELQYSDVDSPDNTLQMIQFAISMTG